MKWVTASLIGLLFAMPLLAQEPVTREREHVVRVGDTLWDLAGFYFDNPFQWRTIYQANRMVVEDPHWIYPTEVLTIPGIPGLAGEAGPAGQGDPVGPRTEATQPAERPLRTVFYRPPPERQATSDASVLSEPGMETLPVRPGEFTSAPYLMDPGQLDVRAMFMRAIRDDVAGRGAATSAHPQDRVYLSYGSGARPEVGDRLSVVEVGRHVDGAHGRARLIHPRAVVRIVELNADVMEGQLESQYGPVHPEQLVIPIEAFPDFQVESPSLVEGGPDLEGQILEFVGQQPLPGRAALALINLGRRQGVQEGDIFEAYRPTRSSREAVLGDLRGRAEMLPAEVVAELRVVRVTERYATVMVENMQLPRLGEEMPVRRIRKIP